MTGRLLDGDEDGNGGETHLFGDQAENNFFCFYSGFGGDRDLDNVDLVKFLQACRAVLGDDFYSSLDYNNDVDQIELSCFLNR